MGILFSIILIVLIIQTYFKTYFKSVFLQIWIKNELNRLEFTFYHQLKDEFILKHS